MPKTNVKNIHKEKRRKRAGCDLNPTDSITTGSEKDRNQSELPNIDALQASKDIKSSSTIEKIENYEIFKANSDCNQEIVSLHEKIVDLINQRDDLIRYHRILSLERNDYFKNINPKSLESEIADLKLTVEMLKKGFNFVLDEHSVIKHLVTDQLKDVNSLSEWNAVKGYPKNIHNCSDHLEKLVSPRFKESSSFPLNCINSNKNLIDIFRNSSTINSNIQLLKTISEINCFGNSEKSDSMAKFRQLAELKIIIEILDKYSKIVTDEFKSINTNVINNCTKDSIEIPSNGPEVTKKSFIEIPKLIKNSNIVHNNTCPTEEHFDFHLKTNDKIHLQDHYDRSRFGIVLPVSEKHFKTSGSNNPVRSSYKPEVNNLKTSFEKPQDLIISSNKCKGTQTIVIEEQLPASTDVFKYNCREDITNTLPNCVELNKSKCKSLKESFLLDEPNLKMDCKLRLVETLSTVLLDSFGEDSNNANKKKVLFLSDGHGRHCSHILQYELGCEFSVISVVKPDACFEEIIRDFHHLASSFSRKDYVIICAGSNNLKCKDKTQRHIEFELVLPILEHTNVIFTKIPLLFDLPSFNSQIRRVNSESSKRVFELAKKNSNILQMPKFTFFSRDCQNQSFNLNKIGKKALCKLLAKIIINDSFSKRQKTLKDSQCNKTSKSFASKLTKINKNKHIINQPLKKSVQTQTSKEYLDYSLQVTNNKILNVNPERHSVLKASYISKKINGKTNSCTQSTMMEENSKSSRVVDDIPSNYYKEDYGQRQGFFAGIFMKNNHTNMTTIKELLGQGDIPKPKKNFIQENVKRLKELKLEKTNKLSSQRSKNLQPLMERRNAQTMVSSSRFSQRPSVSGRPSSQQSPSPPLRSRRPTKHVTLDTQLPIVEVDESPKGYRSQGCQTLNGKQLEHLYEEGVIRYPSVREILSEEEGEGRTVREMALQTEAPREVLHPPSPPLHIGPPQPDEGGLHWDEEKRIGEKDFVRMNATIPDPRRHKDNIKTPDPSSTDPTRAPPTYQRGVVPKYLREQKKEMEKERINKAKEDECPEGHIQLPDDIKQKHLTTLRQNYTELVSQLNQLPVSTDTLRTRTRKKQIETDLDRIEAAIALFSREKVFVKADS